MKLFEFLIIDELGAVHAHVKAEDRISALSKYIGTEVSEITASNLFCILKDNVDQFKKNISNIK